MCLLDDICEDLCDYKLGFNLWEIQQKFTKNKVRLWKMAAVCCLVLDLVIVTIKNFYVNLHTMLTMIVLGTCYLSLSF